MTPTYLLASGMVLGLTAPGLVSAQAEGLQRPYGAGFQFHRLMTHGYAIQAEDIASDARFALDTMAGDTRQHSGRVGLGLQLSPRHELRLLYAPNHVDEAGLGPYPSVFADRADAAGPGIQPIYRFDSYRLGWRYTMIENAEWTWKLGATTRVRNAEISLRQGEVMESRRDTSLLPLLTVYGEYRFAPRWRGILDFEGLTGGGGRAIDLGLRVSYDMSRNWALGAGYRVLDTSIDGASVYNFGRFNSLGINARYRW